MAFTSDIVESWRRPRVVVRRLLGRGRSETFALSFLLVFLLLAFAAAAPNLARQAILDPSVTLTQRLYPAALGLLATVPLWYLLAAIGHLVALAMGGKGSHFGARLALFWALVVISPAMLVQGLVQGMIGGSTSTGLGVLVLAGFLGFWGVMLQEVER
jgi:hypothetical protein